jgi:hypothetical protein
MENGLTKYIRRTTYRGILLLALGVFYAFIGSERLHNWFPLYFSVFGVAILAEGFLLRRWTEKKHLSDDIEVMEAIRAFPSGIWIVIPIVVVIGFLVLDEVYHIHRFNEFGFMSLIACFLIWKALRMKTIFEILKKQ